MAKTKLVKKGPPQYSYKIQTGDGSWIEATSLTEWDTVHCLVHDLNPDDLDLEVGHTIQITRTR